MLFSADFPPVLSMKVELKPINYNRFHHIACNHSHPYGCVSHRKSTWLTSLYTRLFGALMGSGRSESQHYFGYKAGNIWLLSTTVTTFILHIKRYLCRYLLINLPVTYFERRINWTVFNTNLCSYRRKSTNKWMLSKI